MQDLIRRGCSRMRRSSGGKLAWVARGGSYEGRSSSSVGTLSPFAQLRSPLASLPSLSAMQSIPQVLHETTQPDIYQDNRSAYSLATVHDDPFPTQRTALLSSTDNSYGTTEPARPSSRRILMNATLKMAVIFIVSTAFLGATLWLALPTLDE